MPTPTAPSDVKRIDAMLHAVNDTLGYLHARWQDEREFEDIEDYAKPIRPLLPEGFTLRRMTKRPFGFEFDIGTEAIYQTYATARQVGWKRLK